MKHVIQMRNGQNIPYAEFCKHMAIIHKNRIPIH